MSWTPSSMADFFSYDVCVGFCIHRTEGFVDKIGKKPHRRYIHQPSRNRFALDQVNSRCALYGEMRKYVLISLLDH